MKNIVLSVLTAVIFISCIRNNEKKEVLHVSGNCGMCKKTIEGSLNVEGIYEANWDKKTKELKVSFDSILISLPTIATYISKSGYDNELVKGNDEAYQNLHECCKYEREEE